jgi:GDP/UDP-N,N'-diacetylbacillosamine 2-epimerase (hydrolysing)
MIKICFLTGTRAEYGLLSSLMRAIKEDDNFELQLLVTGMHLSPEFGLTYHEINNDGFDINEKVEILLSSDTDIGIIKSTGLGMIGFADALFRLKPDMLVLLGDRFETFAAATAAYLSKIPIVHLHGGELTEGATDDALRHAISKMAFWHFTSTEKYRQRVIQLGESPDRVFNVGALGVENIKTLKLLSKEQLEENLKLDLSKDFSLVTFHPTTLEHNSAENQFKELLLALGKTKNMFFIITKANADSNGRIINSLIDEFVAEMPNKSVCFTSLGQLRYLSLMKYASIVIGNSSSGIIETPTFQIPTINIGDRQKGREKVKTVIDTEPNNESILLAFKKATSPSFISFCKTVSNVYGEGNTVSKIIPHLKKSKQITNLKKEFYDIQQG